MPNSDKHTLTDSFTPQLTATLEPGETYHAVESIDSRPSGMEVGDSNA